MPHGFSRRSALIAGTSILAAPLVARAQAPRLRFTLDWAFQAPNAFALLARDKGYFRDAGIDVQIDRGQGSGGVPVALAGEITPSRSIRSMRLAALL